MESDLDVQQYVKGVMSDANKENEFIRHKEHFKILKELFIHGEADVANDSKWVALLNKPKGIDDTKSALSLEQYMMLFPEDCQDAMKAAKFNREQLMNDGINRKSLAFYSFLGSPPECISKLFSEIYEDANDRRKAWYRFFREFPAFKVTTRSI